MGQRVKDIMITNLKTVGGLTTISDVLKILKNETELQTIIVEPRDDNDVYGIVTLRDIARKVIAEGKRMNEVHAYEIMAKPAVTVNSTMSVMYAARFLTNLNISRALVMENDKLV